MSMTSLPLGLTLTGPEFSLQAKLFSKITLLLIDTAGQIYDACYFVSSSSMRIGHTLSCQGRIFRYLQIKISFSECQCVSLKSGGYWL